MQLSLPRTPGVYLFKNDKNEILYIGKAKCLKSRVRSYFQKNNPVAKVGFLVEEHATISWISTKNEIEALLLEAQLIARYEPKYNVLLKKGQPFVYIVFTKCLDTWNGRGHLPQLKIVRNKKDKGVYFGPFLHKGDARKMYDFLRQIFKLNICNKSIANGCLQYHLGNCTGNCKDGFSVKDYLFRLQLAMDVLKNNQKQFRKKIKEKIAEYNNELAFEKARKLISYLDRFETIFETLSTKFKESKFEPAIFQATAPEKTNYAQTSKELQELTKAEKPIVSIDCFDISHFQSSYLVGSCVRFVNGKPDKNSFRRFKIKTLTEQNDYACLQEIVSRRYRNIDEIPDLVLIDGGKGQLSAVKKVIPNVNCISLAKREETIYGQHCKDGIKLDVKTDIGKLLISLRDYAHHFAISYHRLKRKITKH